ncbi:tRNA preQ1(34) S-adenosylmethionine ribosyltransferase-isomerase QueA [Candidatus Poribacteria bacterium]|nr:tRNA preQ1(34) S-adenosylmethionine ribosyltransferase-isomerase QueA [Candidatus Poribacteria bacterium]
MRAADFDYDLPEELIAAEPAPRREQSRLLVVPPGETSPPIHGTFAELPKYLRAGDVLVLNNSRVLPARLFGRRIPGGGQCEVLLLSRLPDTAESVVRWETLARPGRKLHAGARIGFGAGVQAVIESVLPGGERVLAFGCPEPEFRQLLDSEGNMPLPPYILARRGERTSRPADRERYQTVYAEPEGSVAAPTAGLHFTGDLLCHIQNLGITTVFITLHVGTGTFRPISAERLEDHVMHEESFSIRPEDAEAIMQARRRGGRVFCVGTTTVRALESAATDEGAIRPGSGATRLMILPGYRFRVAEGLVTNFHLPRSTLMCLVAAMTGRDRLLALYEEAIRKRYRFYSYGDAMLVLPKS